MTSLHGLVAIPSTDSCRAELHLGIEEELLEDGRGRELDQAQAA
jgi:hypothetical protein